MQKWEYDKLLQKVFELVLSYKHKFVCIYFLKEINIESWKWGGLQENDRSTPPASGNGSGPESKNTVSNRIDGQVDGTEYQASVRLRLNVGLQMLLASRCLRPICSMLLLSSVL